MLSASAQPPMVGSHRRPHYRRPLPPLLRRHVGDRGVCCIALAPRVFV